MRTITGPAQAKAIQQYGHDPILVVKIDWPLPVGPAYYAGRDLVIEDISAGGRLLSAGNISTAQKQDNVGTIGRMAIELDDADGGLKAIIDSVDVEYRTLTVYQWFYGLLLKSDLCRVFQGQIVGPITWSDDKRTLSLDVETRVQDQEIGLSADVGSIKYLNPDAVDKAWPLSFGNVVHSAALKLLTAPSGRLKYPFRGPRTPGLQEPTADPYLDDTHFTLQDGDGFYFPQGEVVQVQINGVIFSGMFQGTTESPSDVFAVGDNNLPKYENIQFSTRGLNVPYDGFQDPDASVLLPYVAWLENTTSIVNNYIFVRTKAGNTIYMRVVRQEGNKVWFDEKITVSENTMPQDPTPESSGNFATGGVALPGLEISPLVTPSGEFTPEGSPATSGYGAQFYFFGPGDVILEVAKNGRVGWVVTESSTANDQMQTVEVLSTALWRFPPETEVTLWQPFHKDVYVANLIPAATIVAVYAAKRSRDGVQDLHAVPSYYYRIVLSDTIVVHNKIGDVTAHPTTITFDTPLKDYVDQGWSDQIYVVMRSTVGPNTADVIKWLVDTYSLLPTDAASFADVAAQIVNYPCAFTLHEKDNVISIVERIAFCARLGVIIDNGQVAVKYLSTEPATDVTIAEAQTKLMSLDLTFTSTEDVYTRIVGKMRLSYYPAKRFEKEMVYSANTSKFGLRRREIDFFIYNIQSLAQKSLDFWGGRFTNSWRLANLVVSLEGLRLQMFDTVALAFADQGLVNAASIKTVVTKDDYVPGKDEVKLQLWLPSVAGTKTVSTSAWRSDAGDVAPADPTLKYAVSAFDLQRPNGESQRNVQTKQVGGSTPAQVVALNEAGDVTNSDTSAGNANEGQTPVVVKINEYGNGFGSPPTKTGVLATCVDSLSTPVVGQRVVAINLANKTYIDVPGAGTGGLPAKVTASPGGGIVTLDLFTNGYDKPAASTGVTAYVIDLASTNFAIGDQVAAFTAGGKTWVATSRPYGQVTDRLIFSARITGGGGEGAGTYAFSETTAPQGILKPGGVTGVALEVTASVDVSTGTDVFIIVLGGHYYFPMQLGVCA